MFNNNSSYVARVWYFTVSSIFILTVFFWFGPYSLFSRTIADGYKINFGFTGYEYFNLSVIVFLCFLFASYLQMRRQQKERFSYNNYVLSFWLLIGLIPSVQVGYEVLFKGQSLGEFGGFVFLLTLIFWIAPTFVSYFTARSLAYMIFLNRTFFHILILFCSLLLLGLSLYHNYDNRFTILKLW